MTVDPAPENLSDADLRDYLRQWQRARQACLARAETAGIAAADRALRAGRAEAARRRWPRASVDRP